MPQSLGAAAQSILEREISHRIPLFDDLTARVIDDDPHLLEQSYRLRYQVYCLERQFLPESDYPEKLERDRWDSHAIHIGVVNGYGTLVGTARLIPPSNLGFPMLHHCSLYPHVSLLTEPSVSLVEASRLSVSRNTVRTASSNGLEGATHYKGGVVMLHVLKGLYQTSKRKGFTHWLAATERSLNRMMLRYGFPWILAGPEADYYGPVSAYHMAFAEFDEVILSGRSAHIANFMDGLEPEFVPRKRDAWRLLDSTV